jgi:hypothetical protein
MPGRYSSTAPPRITGAGPNVPSLRPAVVNILDLANPRHEPSSAGLDPSSQANVPRGVVSPYDRLGGGDHGRMALPLSSRRVSTTGRWWSSILAGGPDGTAGFRPRILGRFAWPPWRRENGGATVRDAVFAVMPVSSRPRMAVGATDRNCRLLLEHEGQTL